MGEERGVDRNEGGRVVGVEGGVGGGVWGPGFAVV